METRSAEAGRPSQSLAQTQVQRLRDLPREHPGARRLSLCMSMREDCAQPQPPLARTKPTSDTPARTNPSDFARTTSPPGRAECLQQAISPPDQARSAQPASTRTDQSLTFDHRPLITDHAHHVINPRARPRSRRGGSGPWCPWAHPGRSWPATGACCPRPWRSGTRAPSRPGRNQGDSCS